MLETHIKLQAVVVFFRTGIGPGFIHEIGHVGVPVWGDRIAAFQDMSFTIRTTTGEIRVGEQTENRVCCV